MTRPPALLAALLRLTVTLAGPAALAQPTFLGEPFPLTNTRYTTSTGSLRIVTGAPGPALFWSDDTHIRMTPLDADPAHLGRVVDDGYHLRFDVTSVGTHYLIAQGATVTAIDERGARTAPPTLISSLGWDGRIASNGTATLLVFGESNRIRVQRLTRDGTPDPAYVPEQLPLAMYALVANDRSFALATADLARTIRVRFYDRDGRFASEAEMKTPQSIADIAVATDGDRYLLVWTEGVPWRPERVYACVVERDGTFGARLILGMPDAVASGHARAEAVWSGREWIASYALWATGGIRHRIVRMNSAATALTDFEEFQADDIALGVVNGEAVAAVSNGEEVTRSRLPVAAHSSSSIGWRPANQKLLGTAAGPDGTLVIWREKSGTYTGLLRTDGRWSEQHLTANTEAYGAITEWGGSEFLAALPFGVFRLDGTGRPIEGPIRTAEVPDDIVRLGNTWLATRSGSVEPIFGNGPVWRAEPRIGTVGTSAIATDGEKLLVVWNEWTECGDSCSRPVALVGMRLTADLRKIGEPFLISEDAPYGIHLCWTGRAYVINGRTAVTGDGEIHHPSFEQCGFGPAGAYEKVVNDAPFYGSTRLVGHVNGTGPPRPPSAPLLSAFPDNGAYRLSWLAPNEPVSGYRVEWKSGDDSWRELDHALEPDERTATIVAGHPRAPITLRVRAWNEDGAGEYSNVVVFHPPRRRASR